MVGDKVKVERRWGKCVRRVGDIVKVERRGGK